MRRPIDHSLFLSILFLLGLGLVQVYSSSFIFAIESFSDGLFFVKKQALFVAIGIAVLLITAYAPWKWIEKISLGLWALAVVGLVLTLIPGVGVKVGGAARWLSVGGGYRLEPSEILKYTYPIVLAAIYGQDTFHLSRAKQLAILSVPLIPLVILLRQPDFGSMAIISTVIFIVLFAQGLSWRYVLTGATAMVAAFYFLVVRVDYRMARVLAFVDPWSDPARKGFQVIQSMLGFYSGGVTGVGMGQGQGKLFFLPEAHTDFTLSVLGEELGFVGIAVVMTVFAYIVLRGLQISAKSKDQQRKVAALGITLIFAITCLINAGVAMGLFPTKGLGMPFLSYGGSALIASCFGLGMLINIDRLDRAEKARSFFKIQN